MPPADHPSSEKPQTLKNHGRLDPPQHFFVVPILLINLFVTIGVAVHHPDHNLTLHIWIAIMALALLVLAVNMRAKDLKGQDRIIRLEEKLRYAALLTPAQQEAAARLTLRQIIALRFASDAELPGLITRTLAENLEPKQIKATIQNWRGDYQRV